MLGRERFEVYFVAVEVVKEEQKLGEEVHDNWFRDIAFVLIYVLY